MGLESAEMSSSEGVLRYQETHFVARTSLQTKFLFKIHTFGFSHKTRIQNLICQSKCSSKRLCCGQSCLVLFHLLLADRCPKISQIRTLKLKKPVASPQVPDSLQDSKNLCNDCGM